MKNELQNFYLNKTEPNRSCLLALRSLILEFDPNITETLKWSMPCFCFKNKMFCFLWVDKKTDFPYLLMVEGKHLNHPELKTGTRSRMKILTINPNKDIPVKTIEVILNKALELYKTDKIKIK